MRVAALLGLGLLTACSGPPPANEQDVAAALAQAVLRPLGDVLVTSRPSHCATDGETDAPIPAELFASYLAANGSGVAPLDLTTFTDLRLAAAETSPRRLAAERAETVVALSRIGLVANQALVCIEVFGTEERGFLLQLARAPDGAWAIRAEHHAWQREPMPWEQPPEEMPDGTEYRPPSG